MGCAAACERGTMPIALFQHHNCRNVNQTFRFPARLYATVSCYSAMKLHSTDTRQYQTVTAYDENGVEINAVYFNHSLMVMPESEPQAWPVTSFEALAPEHFEAINAAAPEVVILGTGSRQRFIHPKLVTSLTARQVGVEAMDNKAACRTYNILMAEGRRVALALIIEGTQAPQGTVAA